MAAAKMHKIVDKTNGKVRCSKIGVPADNYTAIDENVTCAGCLKQMKNKARRLNELEFGPRFQQGHPPAGYKSRR